MAKILLVDDDTTFCLMLKTWLTKRGFEVENAFSCREALAKLKGTKYDVVLTDLRLPDEDGIYLLKNIKASTPEVQVILMTGYADIQTAVLAMKLGAFDYVAKPVIPDEILKKIQDTLEQTAVPEQKKRTKKPQSVPYIKGTSLEALRKMRDDGKAIIIITHKMHEVESLSDRVAVLRDGRRTGVP